MRKSEKLQRLYSKLPRLNCQKKCQDSCGPIAMTGTEHRAILERTGLKRVYCNKDTMNCGLLRDGVCSVYDIRPLICRLWGIVDNPKMKCPHGCIPDYWLTDRQAHAFMAEANKISGDEIVVLMPEDYKDGM